MTLLDGKALAEKVKKQTREEAAMLLRHPGLAVVLVGDDPASQVYVRGKKRDCEECGFYSEEYVLPETVTQQELLDLVESLNGRADIDGILVQLPLPKHINEREIIASIAPEKDVDCFHPQKVGAMFI